jgi:hypothetical protein
LITSTRRFNASSAELKKLMGLDLCWEAALRDLQFPGSAWELDCSSIQPQQEMKTKNMKTLHLRKSISPECFRNFLLTALVLCCFGLWPAPKVFGVSPPPDGGYPRNNTAEGDSALFSLTTGADNTANGLAALYSDTTGGDNTANGDSALYHNTTGDENTANGVAALYYNTTGSYNTANGNSALNYNTTGSFNTADGLAALYSNTTGSYNIALGFNAGFNLTTGSNNIDIGNLGVAAEAHTIRIGDANQTRTFIAGIGPAAFGGTAVYVNSDGQLGTRTSSARFKQDIHSMDKASEAILALKPVTFRYKQELDPQGIPQFGLVAEEVEKVNPDLVVRDAQGKVFTVRYEAVNAMLLNEFLKEHRTVQELKSTAAKQEATIAQQQRDLQATIGKLEATIARQQKGMEILTAHLEEQALQIQKVSAQLELSESAPQMASNN